MTIALHGCWWVRGPLPRRKRQLPRARKTALAGMVERCRKVWPEDFRFVPETWSLPRQAEECAAAMAAICSATEESRQLVVRANSTDCDVSTDVRPLLENNRASNCVCRPLAGDCWSWMCNLQCHAFFPAQRVSNDPASCCRFP